MSLLLSLNTRTIPPTVHEASEFAEKVFLGNSLTGRWYGVYYRQTREEAAMTGNETKRVGKAKGFCSYWKHLRPYGKRTANKKSRKAAKGEAS